MISVIGATASSGRLANMPIWRVYLRPHAGWLVLLCAWGLAVIGVTAIGTTSPQAASGQVRWLIISTALLIGCLLPRPRLIGRVAIPMLVVHLVVLFVMVTPLVPRGLVPSVHGAKSWIRLGSMGFQPSETAKIFFVLAMAWRLRHARGYRSLRGLLTQFLIMLVPVALIFKQPDLGTAILFAPTLFLMLVAAGAKLRHMGLLVAVAVAVTAINFAAVFFLPENAQLLKPHQQTRIRAMFAQIQGDRKYINTAGYQQDKAITLIGSGGMIGYGKDRASDLIEMNALPEEHNDMIFVVIVNRWGLLGGLGTLGIYALLIGSFLIVAATSRDPFVRLSVVGFAGLLFTQVVINVGVAIGLMPVTGITLPFVSYGGSSLLAMFIMIGLTVNFAARPSVIFASSNFDYDHSCHVMP